MTSKINKKDYPKILRSNPKIKWRTAGMMVVARPKIIPLVLAYLVALKLFHAHGFITALLCIALVICGVLIYLNASKICKDELSREMNGNPATALRNKVDREAAKSDKGIIIGAFVGLCLVGFLVGGTAGRSICPYCGAYIGAGDEYCPDCGKPLF